MSELSDYLKHEIWKRDGNRCQECGIVVGKRENGCKPQTHHRKPRSMGGGDDQENLITLCLPCHSTKNSGGHISLLEKVTPDEWPSYVKWGLWEEATELLVYAERLCALRFPADDILKRLDALQGTIETLRRWTLTAIRDNPKVMANNCDEIPYETSEELESILRGVQISYWARHNQEVLDEEVRGG